MNNQAQYCESISLPEVLSIRNASEVYSKIIDQFRDNNNIILSLPENAEADLSFLQLIEAARRQAKAAGKTFTLSAPVGGSLLKVLERAGFTAAFDQEDQKFWLHKEVTL
ncbi:MFS superfamily sulfate permease-like transporter [Rhizobium sp. BK529]|uniref:STAS domain-containing protein n=1 Tax=unclassified Rhizobium TaxID=2613769 RepID=UPI001046FFFB|nr:MULTISPECIES: STAS domain-containing protein [unclassified Rhizobium]MBB3595510.1 MFS superfamily sulfate permease-like transporter [Rhizobium sp. BK529]TCS00700.1 STAS domain-containing protein [Rhizobium sp. BK418]